MAWQLVYTSAPALLDAGRTGFGTVARHEAIRPALQTEVERISQFSREQGLSKDRILYYHRVIDLRGERHHILSRIKDAGADYTGRTNHIAHHIVLSAAEADHAYRANRCTPADMILWITSNGLWRDQWNEAARILNASEEIAVGAIPARLSLPAVSWGSVTGSSGIAAILAPGGTATEGCWLLYRADQASQLLALIGESLCLNPNPWAISFATDTQPTDRIEEIQWRGIELGSPLERTARQSVRPVLDLGNPASLPSPVESARHLAETGLLKAPEPISNHIREADSGRVERGRLLTVSSFDSPAHQGGAGGGYAKLGEKMKRGGSPHNPSKSKGFPLHLISIGLTIALITLSVILVYDKCMIDEGKCEKMIQNTQTIANKLSDYINPQGKGMGEGKVDDKWKEELFPQTFPIAGYRIVLPGFKSEFYEARGRVDGLLTEKDNDLLKSFESLAKPETTKSELLSKIVEKIKEVKLSAEKQAQEEADKKQRREAEHQRQLKVQQEKEKAAADKRSEESKAAAQAIASPTPAPTPVPQKIVKIEFWKPLKPEDTASKRYFNDQMMISGWSWKTNDYATSISQLEASARDTNNWISNSVNSSRDQFNARATNPGFCFLRKEDSSKEVTITITSSENAFTNKIGFQPIVLEKAGEKYAGKLSSNIAACLQLFAPPIYSIDYQIINPQYTGKSLESLADQINQKIKALEENIATAQGKLDQSLSSNNQHKAEIQPSNPGFEILDKAGETLSQGLNFNSSMKKEGFPEELKSFTAWLNKKAKTNDPRERVENFKQYLRGVFDTICKCNDGTSLTTIKDDFITATHGPEELFEERVKNKPPLNPNNSYKNDPTILHNISTYFTADNAKNLKAFLAPANPSPTPNYRLKLEAAKKDRSDYAASLDKYQSQITIKDDKGSTLLIFTP